MAYANGYNGDVEQLHYILSTLKEKLYIIPGVTCNPNLSVSAGGESLTYGVSSGTSGAVGTLGAALTSTSKGKTNVTLSFTQGWQFWDIIPGANLQTVKAEQVGAKLTEETIAGANAINEDFIAKVAAASTASTVTAPTDEDDVYLRVSELAGAYKKENDGHLKPTAFMCASDIYSWLIAKQIVIFKDGEVINNRLGFAIIEVPSLDDGKGYMLDAQVMVAAQNVRSVEVGSALANGYPGGVGVGGEIGFINAAAQLDDNTLVPVMGFAA